MKKSLVQGTNERTGREGQRRPRRIRDLCSVGISARGREVEFILPTGDPTAVSTPIGTA